jgi:hypothetical protein
MVQNSGRPEFPILYLIIPIVIGCAFAIPAGDALLQVLAIEPTDVAKFIVRASAGLVVAAIPLLVLIAIRRDGKN